MLSETFTLPLLPHLIQASSQVLQFTLIVSNAHFIQISPLTRSLTNYFEPFITQLTISPHQIVSILFQILRNIQCIKLNLKY